MAGDRKARLSFGYVFTPTQGLLCFIVTERLGLIAKPPPTSGDEGELCSRSEFLRFKRDFNNAVYMESLVCDGAWTILTHHRLVIMAS